MVESIKEDVNKNYIFRLLDDIILKIQKYKIEPLLSEEIIDRERRQPEKLKTDDDFLRAIANLITFSQNARSDKVQNIWKNTDYFEQAFCRFDVETVVNLNSQKIVIDYWGKIKIIRFKKKIDSIIGCAQSIKEISHKHGSFLNFFQDIAIPKQIKNGEDINNFWLGFNSLLREFKEIKMPFLGNVTTLLHLLLDMGYDCVKPDIILLKFANEIGISNKKKFVRTLQEYSLLRNIRPSLVDLYLLIYGKQLGAKHFVRSEYYLK
jgi:3-methyladenine DNA glycosylase Tag